MSEEYKVPFAAEQADGAVGPALAEHVAAIKTLGRRVVADVIEIGRRLVDCRAILKEDGKWRAWLKDEFDWGRSTADNFINVYKLSESEGPNFGHLDLPLSALYLLAAPSTPTEARDQIIEQAKAGEPVSVAAITETIKKAKGCKQPAKRSRNHSRANLHRSIKLGTDVVEKIKGTSLDNAREMDELVILNRGASEGGHTEAVEQLVAAAAAGKAVSAVAYTKRGAAFRRDPIATASSGESAPVEESDAQLKHFESQNTVLRSEVRELKAALANKLAAVSNERLLAELERRLPSTFLKTHQAAMKAIVCSMPRTPARRWISKPSPSSIPRRPITEFRAPAREPPAAGAGCRAGTGPALERRPAM